MKKYVVFAMALASISSFADTQQNNNAALENKPPMMVLSTVDVSGKVPKALHSTKYSISKGKTELCWEAINIPFTAKNTVVEIFNSPKSTKFADPNGSVVKSNKGKTHTITTYMPSINNEVIRRCWKFDKTDPLGNYTIEVKINDVIFPPQKFTIVK